MVAIRAIENKSHDVFSIIHVTAVRCLYEGNAILSPSLVGVF